MPGKKKRRKNRFNNTIVLGIMLAMGLVTFIMIMDSGDLRSRDQGLVMRIETIKGMLEAEDRRTEELLQKKQYVKTHQYIEEVAREKLGLLKPDEVLIKEKIE